MPLRLKPLHSEPYTGPDWPLHSLSSSQLFTFSFIKQPFPCANREQQAAGALEWSFLKSRLAC
jgi:hypothetical protein